MEEKAQTRKGQVLSKSRQEKKTKDFLENKSLPKFYSVSSKEHSQKPKSMSEVKSKSKLPTHIFNLYKNSTPGRYDPKDAYDKATPNAKVRIKRYSKFNTPRKNISGFNNRLELEEEIKKLEEHFNKEMQTMKDEITRLNNYIDYLRNSNKSKETTLEELSLEKDVLKDEYLEIVCFLTDIILKLDINSAHSKTIVEKLQEKEVQLQMSLSKALHSLNEPKSDFNLPEMNPFNLSRSSSLPSTGRFQQLEECYVPSITDPPFQRPTIEAIALYDYKPQTKNHLEFLAGERIVVLHQTDNGWWIGKCRDKVGSFPKSYVMMD